MDLRCVAALTGVSLLALAGVAAAQGTFGTMPTFETAPAAPPPGTGFPPPGARPPPQASPPAAMAPPGAPQEPPCMREFMPLREDMQKRGVLIQKAQERTPTREEMCQLFKNFTAAEAKVVKFVTDKQASCEIPNEVVTKIKTDYGQHVKVREQICKGGPAAGKAAAPPTPKLSDELGLRGIADPTTSSSGRGTFDTLTGNPFQR